MCRLTFPPSISLVLRCTSKRGLADLVMFVKGRLPQMQQPRTLVFGRRTTAGLRPLPSRHGHHLQKRYTLVCGRLACPVCHRVLSPSRAHPCVSPAHVRRGPDEGSCSPSAQAPWIDRVAPPGLDSNNIDYETSAKDIDPSSGQI